MSTDNLHLISPLRRIKAKEANMSCYQNIAVTGVGVASEAEQAVLTEDQGIRKYWKGRGERALGF